MGLKRTAKFRQDAVRIALTSGLTRKQGADDPGVGLSTLNQWITAHRDTDVVSKQDLGLAQENDRLRRENRILTEERDILKKSDAVLRKPKGVRFRFVEEHCGT
jgi:transposase-like protein